MHCRALFNDEALEILGRKKNLRVLEGHASWKEHALDYKRVRGGFLVQERALPIAEIATWTVVTKRQPSDEERKNLMFAWRAVGA